ncbi:MAG: hypothetical protein SGILL_000470, partial [Bacillariaceae sp.]
KNAELDEKDEMIAREKKDHAATKRILEMDRKNTHPTAVSPLARAPNHTMAAAVNPDTTPKKNKNTRDAVEAVMDLATHGDRSNAEAIEKNANDSLPTTVPSPNHFRTHTQAGKLQALAVAENNASQMRQTDKTGGTHRATVAAASPHLGSPPTSSHASTRPEVTPLGSYPSLPSMATEPSTVSATAANAFNNPNSTVEEFPNNWEEEFPNNWEGSSDGDDEEMAADSSAMKGDAVDGQSQLNGVSEEENQSSKDIMGLLNVMHAKAKANEQNEKAQKKRKAEELKEQAQKKRKAEELKEQADESDGQQEATVTAEEIFGSNDAVVLFASEAAEKKCFESYGRGQLYGRNKAARKFGSVDSPPGNEAFYAFCRTNACKDGKLLPRTDATAKGIVDAAISKGFAFYFFSHDDGKFFDAQNDDESLVNGARELALKKIFNLLFFVSPKLPSHPEFPLETDLVTLSTFAGDQKLWDLCNSAVCELVGGITICECDVSRRAKTLSLMNLSPEKIPFGLLG